MSITELYTVFSDSFDPYSNLAREEALLNLCKEGQLYLYLWQNANTVVIGKNQSALRECRIQQLEEDGGHLARRLSGGGAVYHDLGNLNFTFVTWKDDYDLHRQYQVIQRALETYGIHSEFSGRNDLLIDGKKFSGSAYCYSKTACYHHGTLMVDVDLQKAQQYLNASKAKLQAHGVDSVRSRIINLKSVCPDLTIEELKQSLVTSCEAEYALQAEEITVPADAGKYGSRQWLYRKEAERGYECSRKLSFGEVTVRFSLSDGLISDPAVFTDAMVDDFSDQLETLMNGTDTRQLPQILKASDLPHRDELAEMMEEVQ